MTRAIGARALAVLTIAWSSSSLGCASMSDVVIERNAGGGTARTYPVPTHVAYAAARESLQAEKVDELHEYPSHLTADTGATFLSWGALVGVFFEPSGPWATRVVVVVKRKLATNIFVPFDEDDLHRRLATRLSAWLPQPVPAPSSRPTTPPPRPPSVPELAPPPPALPPPGTI